MKPNAKRLFLLLGSSLLATPAFAVNTTGVTNTYNGSTAANGLSTGGNWTLGTPVGTGGAGSYSDLLLTTGATGSTFTASGGSITNILAESFNVTNGRSYTVQINSTTSASFNVGATSNTGNSIVILPFTNSVSGVAQDLIHLSNGSSLTFNATNTGGGSATTFVIRQAGNFNVGSGSILTINPVISGTANLTINGGGTTIFTGENTYTGATTISAGILQVGNGGTTGRLGGNGTSTASDTFIGSNAELKINRSGTGYDYYGVLSGSGTVNIIADSRMNFRTVANQTSSGNLSFLVNGTLGINTSSGVTQVHLGELGGSGTIQRAGGTGGAATLFIGGKGNNSTFAGTIISSELGVEKVGNGTLTLSNTSTYSGATTVSAGTLYVSGALSNSSVTVEANGAIGRNGAGAGTLGNGLTIAAGGSLDLTGATLGPDSTGILSLTGGSLTLGNLTFQDLLGWDWANADVGTYELIDGAFSIDWGSTAYLSAETAYDFNNGRKGYFTSGSLNVVIIPEPRAALLGGLGLLALLRRRRN